MTWWAITLTTWKMLEWVQIIAYIREPVSCWYIMSLNLGLERITRKKLLSISILTTVSHTMIFKNIFNALRLWERDFLLVITLYYLYLKNLFYIFKIFHIEARIQLRFDMSDRVKIREKQEEVINVYSYQKKYAIVILCYFWWRYYD